MDKKKLADQEDFIQSSVNSVSDNHTQQQQQQQPSNQRTTTNRLPKHEPDDDDNIQNNQQQQIGNNQLSNDDFMENLKILFQECDTDNTGYLGRDKFKDLCLKIGLNENDAYETFDRLDIDQNNTITFEEFCAGFNQYQTSAATINTVDFDNNGVPPHEIDNNVVPDTYQNVKGPPARKGTPDRASPSSAGGGIDGIYIHDDSNISNSLDYQSSSSIRPSTSRGLPNRSRSSSSRLNNISPIGTISLGGDNSLENTHSLQDDGMIVLSSDGGSINVGGQSLNCEKVMKAMEMMEEMETMKQENFKLIANLMKEQQTRVKEFNRFTEEMDNQVRDIENRVGQRAKEEILSEQRQLRKIMKSELDSWQTQYQTAEKLNDWAKNLSSEKTIDTVDKIEKVKSQVAESISENKQLRLSLLNTQTVVETIRNEMEQLKEKYEVKCQELHNERENRVEYDNIKKQLNLMQDSHRTLQDTSDAITTYIADNVDPVVNYSNHLVAPHHSGGAISPGMMSRNSSRHALGAEQSRRGSILSDYIQDLSVASDCKSASITSDLESLTSQMSTNRIPYDDLDDRSSNYNYCKANSNISHIDHSSNNNNNASMGLLHHQSKANSNMTTSIERPLSMQYQQQPQTIANNHQNHFLNPSMTHHHDTTAKNYNSQQQVALKKSRSYQNLQSTNNNNKYQNNLQQQQLATDKISGIISDNGDQQNSLPINTLALSQQQQHDSLGKSFSSMSSVSLPSVELADGPSTTTFDIILVGDSYVGKSSFVARFMEGDFVVGLISNCGIDFKTKTYKVDGINITVNLWDTAGQERFRSITASYFRKADGIILMYDVTEKNSYLNVRNWMSTIMDTAAENVPVLLIGNKIDLRTQHNLNVCVPSEEGRRLGREYDIVFLETSVKDGTNLIGSIGKLVRLMMTKNEKPQENEDTIKLNDRSKASRCMPQKC